MPLRTQQTTTQVLLPVSLLLGVNPPQVDTTTTPYTRDSVSGVPRGVLCLSELRATPFGFDTVTLSLFMLGMFTVCAGYSTVNIEQHFATTSQRDAQLNIMSQEDSPGTMQ